MKEDTSRRDLTKLSVKQQVGLYVVLDKLYDEKNKPFYSSDFAREMQKYLLIEDQDEYRRTIGGILGSLSKNQLLKKMSSDRDPLWMLAEDIHQEAQSYKNDILPVAIHWQQ